MTKEKETKKERAKGFFKNHKTACISSLVLIVSFVAYVFFGYEIDIQPIVDKICVFFGGCQ